MYKDTLYQCLMSYNYLFSQNFNISLTSPIADVIDLPVFAIVQLERTIIYLYIWASYRLNVFTTYSPILLSSTKVSIFPLPPSVMGVHIPLSVFLLCVYGLDKLLNASISDQIPAHLLLV